MELVLAFHGRSRDLGRFSASPSSLVDRLNEEASKIGAEIEDELRKRFRGRFEVNVTFTHGSLEWFGDIKAYVEWAATVGGVAGLVQLVGQLISQVLRRRLGGPHQGLAIPTTEVTVVVLQDPAIGAPHAAAPGPGWWAYQRPSPSSSGLAKSFFDFLGKALVPAAILVIVFSFKPHIEFLISKAEQAEFFGTKIVFGRTKAFTGELTPLALYYLIGSASNYQNARKATLNYQSMDEEARTAIKSLEEKDLVTTKLEIDPSAKFFDHGLTVTPTEKGRRFLVELGLPIK